MTRLPAAQNVADTARKVGTTGALYDAAMTLLHNYPRKKGGPLALKLADRLYTRGSVDKALNIVGEIGFTIPGVEEKQLTGEIVDGMVRVFNRGVARNDRRTVSAAGLFILTGCGKGFSTQKAAVIDQLLASAKDSMDHGEFRNAAILATTVHVGNSLDNSKGTPAAQMLLREIANKAFEAGDNVGCLSAIETVVDSAESRPEREQATRMLFKAARQAPAKLAHNKSISGRSNLEWYANDVVNNMHNLRRDPELLVESVQTLLDLQRRAVVYGHYAAIRKIGERVEDNVKHLTEGCPEMGIRPIGKKWHPALQEVAASASRHVASLGPKKGMTRDMRMRTNGSRPS